MSSLPTLTLYTRAGCHLCEQAEVGLRALDYRYEPVDVDRDPALKARYGDDVPVLVLAQADGPGRVLLKGVLSRGRLSALKLQLLRGAQANRD
ncbi:glutaredoxin family protein [Deinococcus metallilatus]|uniref:Glutaredoxin n=1 Tax=Deinococcus metallilatus TaxID=1211322 RepID=A0AAJ5F0J3_9DEIO|nr:glutaredoxin family protein [Deinococcus metallilatus]MBB5295332.1 glutaredoxin [Deinococcus metallilatus]QBY08514.1 glutaredoxin family protein [Deinococcus metallilatus]RXJ11024.1 glutaredoxin family protein [Deinococcus metallilatus]TLK21598.1 glutaredoxin family protein [Deinococcus metallilatus]GMA15107.1 NrdH-redoxin [Deinococcus metallilatus]